MNGFRVVERVVVLALAQAHDGAVVIQRRVAGVEHDGARVRRRGTVEVARAYGRVTGLAQRRRSLVGHRARVKSAEAIAELEAS